MRGDEHQTVTAELSGVVRRAEANVAGGGGPFAAVVVLPDGRRFEGTNRVVATSDPSAHAEAVAIRPACGATGSVALDGAVVYASCEPCPRCVAVADTAAPRSSATVWLTGVLTWTVRSPRGASRPCSSAR